jgi:hypothetical protein
MLTGEFNEFSKNQVKGEGSIYLVIKDLMVDLDEVANEEERYLGQRKKEYREGKLKIGNKKKDIVYRAGMRCNCLLAPVTNYQSDRYPPNRF